MWERLKKSLERDKTKCKPSLCYRLEFEVGGYNLTGVYDDIEILYYDSRLERLGPIGDINGDAVAYFIENERYAIVEEYFYEKLKKDTVGYDISFFVVKDFEEESLCLDDIKDIEYLKEMLDEFVWIDDDFLSDENIPFDQEAFEVIDSGVLYMNPKHFAVKKLIEVIEDWKKRR